MKKFCIIHIICFIVCASICKAQSNQTNVIATKGDGVYSILRNNGFDPTQFYKEFIELNKNKLGPENKLYVGNTYQLPIISESLNSLIEEKSVKGDSITPTKTILELDVNQVIEPLFGKTHSTVIIENQKLKGATYYLVSGHGGPDPGAVAKYNNKIISEDEYAYDVTLRLAKKLIAHGAEAHIIIKDLDDGIRNAKVLDIDHDEVSYSDKKIPQKQKARLKQRTDEINKLYRNHKGYRRLIVTHVDSRSVGKNIDVFFYHHKFSKNGKRLAKNIQNTFKKKYARYQPNREYSGAISTRNLYMVQNTLPAMTYIELGNIRNKKDQKRILDYENRDAMAKWITEGLVLDFKQE